MLARGNHGVRFWDDPEMDAAVRTVLARVGRDGTFLNYSSVKETIYPRTGTAAPGGIYVNARYWFYLNREGLDARLVEATRSPGTLVLFAEPAGPDAMNERRTALYRFLKESTEEVESLPGGLSWRRVRAAPGAKR
jgi:hypothetical protein